MELRLGGAIALALVAPLALLTAGPVAARSDPGGRRTLLLGHSATGRPILAVETGDFDSPRKALLVGCIHGNEPAGIAIAERLAKGLPPRGLDLWIIPVLNPDGLAAVTRGNGRGVDLNRNFPWHWRPLGGVHNSGPYALSEPESRIAYRLVRRVHPAVSIWFHQHLDVVDESGGSVAVERRFARLSGLTLRRLVRYSGSATGWENQTEPWSTAFVVELPAGSLGADSVTRFAAAVLTVSRLGHDGLQAG